MKQEESKAWYKQFWPWFIISIPLASVIAGINMIIISIDGADTLVDKDYYKEGLAINKQFDKIEKAKHMGIIANLSLEDNKLSLELQSNSPITESLSLEFSHATMPAKDFAVRLQQSAGGNYFAFLDAESANHIKGKWYLKLSPYSEQWQLKAPWNLATEKKLVLGQ